jgi:two-component system, OmpR family, sensor histidine kinase RstB
VCMQLLMRHEAKLLLKARAPAEKRLAVELLRRYVVTLPPERRAAEIRSLSQGIGAGVEQVELSDARLSDTARAALHRNGFEVQYDGHLAGTIWVLGSDGKQALRVGPLEFLPPPRAWPLMVAFISLLLAVAITATLILRPLVRRLRRLQEAAKRISEGKYEARVRVGDGDSAIAVFEANFNQMADRNQTMLEGQRDLLRAVAHELRTPAARIRFELELAEEAATPSERQRHVARVDADLSEMDELIRELLLLDRLQSAHGAPGPGETFSVITAIEEETERAKTLRSGVEVLASFGIPDRTTLTGSQKLFRRAFRNVLSNALRHAHDRVQVTLEDAGGQLRIRVEDDGPGIPASDRNRVLEPFARLDQSRSRESGGLGLGLTIVDRIVTTAGGRLIIGDGQLGGARVEMSWPIEQALQSERER